MIGIVLVYCCERDVGVIMIVLARHIECYCTTAYYQVQYEYDLGRFES
jgi:hypothetical protein